MKNRLVVVIFVASGVLVIGLTATWAVIQRQRHMIRNECRRRLALLYDATGHILPPAPGAERALEPAFSCPGVNRPYKIELAPPQLDETADAAARPGGLRPLAWCPESCHDGFRNVLFDDGTIEALPPDIFEQVLKSRVMTAAQRKLFIPVN